ncbi:hypothetical protein DB30_05719 [Enhygromyxa salina]|uniref:Uncharacterized protein n=1 Tax=Enhygromyxa salina TaxID=215803 RepID=A0A0C2D5I3_9BACT|nr:sigma-70 family RNA polymerase sigma factor [Enhygromyxa salina]KIG15292.1 hypothetical protein DB30_05719 [Enhygromyxa salina]
MTPPRGPVGHRQLPTPKDVARALDGDRPAMQTLVERLLPIVQAEVGYALARGARAESRDARQEIADFVQEVFVGLLERDGKVLRTWDPQRGRSLDSFVRLVARRHVAAILRSGRRSPWSDKPTDIEDLDRARTGSSGSGRFASLEQLDRLLETLSERLDERGILLFELLYIEERAVEEVMELTEMTRDAIYAWRSRFRKLVARLANEAQEQAPMPRKFALVSDPGVTNTKEHSP